MAKLLLDDVIVLPAAPDRWILYNVFTRSSLGVNDQMLAFAGNDNAQIEDGSLRAWQTGYFSNYEGLLADPTRLVRDPAEWPELGCGNADWAHNLLQENTLCCDDQTAYCARFADKESMLDNQHFGNFHQQLSEHLLLERRENPEKWWTDQKFTDDFQSLRNNLYQAVQKPFMEKFITRRLSPGMRVLDIGCGIGYFTNMMAGSGAKVTGIDPTESYLNIARKNAAAGVEYIFAKDGIPESLAQFKDNSFDLVIMSDALLFYFVPYSKEDVPNIATLLEQVKRMLTPGGSFVDIEAHQLFWLTPWLGGEDRPFTLFSEYSKRQFRVVPTMTEFIQAFAKSGFAATWMDEAKPDPAFKEFDARAYHFANSFPMWQLIEFGVIN